MAQTCGNKWLLVPDFMASNLTLHCWRQNLAQKESLTAEHLVITEGKPLNSQGN